MISCMQQHFPKCVSWIQPKGGMFIWVTLPESLMAAALLKKVIQQNVLFVPGENFYFDGTGGRNCLRINFSNPSKEEIQKGIMVLGAAIQEMMA
jgi:2-aminoadipate transaminase